MANFFIISPANVPLNPVLFPEMKPHFCAAGHTFTANMKEADCFLIDLHSRLSPYDQVHIDYILDSGKPLVIFDEWDRGGMSFDLYPQPLNAQQEQIFNHIHHKGIKNVQFCRLLNKMEERPSNLHPYEKPFAHEEPFLTPDELFSRPYDICFIANSAPSREAIAKAIREDGRLKCDILLGGQKLEWVDFLQRHKQAKLFISSGAGGFTDERVQCLFSVSGIIRERSNQLLLHDFDCCLRVDNPPTKEDLDIIYETVNDKEKLYKKYKDGYDLVKTYYSKEYISNDILKKILNTIND